MTATYYIDGYNVIHHCPQLQPLVRSSFEAARDTLIERVARYCAATGERAKIVFDGRGGRLDPVVPFRSGPGFEVVYSPSRQSADTVIEREVYASANRRAIVVVSGDYGIRQLCSALGALVMDPANFLAAVQDTLDRASASLRTQANQYKSAPLGERLTDASRNRLEEIKDALDES